MTIISWEDVFETFEGHIEKVDHFKWVVYGPSLNVIIGDLQERFPVSFKHMFKKYESNFDWVKESWKSERDTEGTTYYRFSDICDKLNFNVYKHMSQRQKTIFKKALEESDEKYTILGDRVAFAPIQE